MQTGSVRELNNRRVRNALVHVRDHSSVDMTLAALAREAGLSRFHFERVFYQRTSRKVAAHVRDMRLRQARTELRQTRKKIIDIALAAGYATHAAFSRAFRQRFGCAPRSCRSLNNHYKHGDVMQKIRFSIGLAKVPVSDLVVSSRYYREVVGLEAEFVVEAYSWAQYRTGNVPPCLYVPSQGGGVGSPFVAAGVHLQVNDLPALREQLIAGEVKLSRS